MKFKVLVMLLCSFMLSIQSVSANPFAGGAVSDNQEQVQQVEKQKPSFTSKVWFKFMKTQRELNKKITGYISEIKEGSSLAFLLVMGFSFLYGVFHAVGPGHGKIIVASYFSSHQAKWWKGVVMGFQIASVHVISAIALVLLTDGITKHFIAGASDELRVIKMVSYAAIALVGFIMLWQTYSDSRKRSANNAEDNPDKEKSSWLLSLSVGLNPCTGALLFLFYAMSKDMLITGLFIVLAMVLGIAVTLSIIGILCILTRKNLGKVGKGDKIKAVTFLRYAGSSLIVIIGISLFVGTL